MLVEQGMNPKLLRNVETNLKTAYPLLKEISTSEIQPSKYSKCLDSSRQQLNGEQLLDFMIKHTQGKEIPLLVTAQDAYSGGLNFVFGVAGRGQGCFVSTYRLGNDPDFVMKECVHEVGHVFGLGHCKLPCVMTFSNSVPEAHMKNYTLCDKCKSQVMEGSH